MAELLQGFSGGGCTTRASAVKPAQPRRTSVPIHEIHGGASEERLLRAAHCGSRTPPLVPLFDRCYLPCRPCLAGNPVFFVADDRVLCCGLDLLHIFTRDSSFQPADRAVVSSSSRDVASNRHRHDSSSSEASTTSSSSSSFSRCLSPPRQPTPLWVDSYLDKLGSMLKKGGWRDREVDEMVEVTTSGFMDNGEEAPTLDSEAILDALDLKTDP
eukprot:XP_008660886.1 uncharacterized protein LOC103639999 [Zea mays]